MALITNNFGAHAGTSSVSLMTAGSKNVWVVNLRAVNNTNAPQKVTIVQTMAAGSFNITKDLTIPANSSWEFANSRFLITAGYGLTVTASTDGAVDVTGSTVEA